MACPRDHMSETRYLAADAPSRASETTAEKLGIGGQPEYAVLNGHLYLRTESTTSGSVFAYSEVDTWDEKLPSFRRAHPELEAFWPAPAKANGGVAWIDVTKR